MAKIKWGMYIVDGRGKQGGHVLSKNRAGAYVRTKVTPSNPQTSFQNAVRALFASITSAWSTLTNAQRLSFESKVSDFSSTDIFGDIRNPTGKNLYQKLNQNLLNTGQPGVSVCPDPAVVPFAQIDTALGDVSNSSLEVTFSGDTTGAQVIVLATPSLSQGTKFIKNKLRQLQVDAGGDNLTLDIYDSYVAKFGIPAAGANIYVGLKVINSVGQASPVETVKAEIVA